MSDSLVSVIVLRFQAKTLHHTRINVKVYKPVPHPAVPNRQICEVGNTVCTLVSK